MKKSLFGITKQLDTLLENRIFKKYTVDAVLQDNSIIIDNNSVCFLKTSPNIADFNFDIIKSERTILYNELIYNIVEKNITDFEKIIAISEYTSKIAYKFPTRHQTNESFYRTCFKITTKII